MVERCNERFFDLPIGGWCGVLIREEAAKKLQKILWRQTQEIRDFLTRNMDALEAKQWTLAYVPEQTIVHYYNGMSKEEIKERISWLNKADRMTFLPDVFKTDQVYIDASREVKLFYEEHYGTIAEEVPGTQAGGNNNVSP